MSKFFLIDPEVAGHFGPKSIFLDRKVRPPTLSRFHYEFDGWMGDEILETVLCFIVTEPLAKALASAGLTGFREDVIHVSKSSLGEESIQQRLPSFVWLKIDGCPGVDDFGIAPAPANRLAVSDKALKVLGKFRTGHMEVKAFAG